MPGSEFAICWYASGVITLLVLLTWDKGYVTIENVVAALLVGSIGPIPFLLALAIRFADVKLIRWSKKSK